MSRMLSLIEAGLALAAQQAQAGRLTAARSTLESLLARPDVPPEVAVRGHRAAASLAAGRECYRRARRHLVAAARLAPQDAGIQYDLGRAFEDDPFGCDRRAARRYRKAAQLNAHEPKYRAALGRAMVRLRETASGVKVLVRAATAAPTDPEVLEVVAEGLREAGRADLAFRVLSKARFLAPNAVSIKQLWTRTKYDLAASRQNSRAVDRQPVMPFLRLHEPENAAGHRTRRDDASRPTSHLGRLRAFRTDRG